MLSVEFAYGSLDPRPLFELESRIEDRLRRSGFGVYDGNQMEPDGSRGRLQLRGPDARPLFEALRPILEDTAFLEGARVRLQHGPPLPGVFVEEFRVGDR